MWNNTTRGPTLAKTIFNDIGDGRGEDIRSGLRSDAAKLVSEALEQSQMRLPKWQSLACLILRNYEFDESANWTQAETELLQSLRMSVEELGQISTSSPLEAPLLSAEEWSLSDLPRKLGPTRVSISSIGDTREKSADSDIDKEDYFTYDERVWSMLKAAIANYKFVVLVGPPGTGKSKLIERLCKDITDNPQSYEFPEHFRPDPIWHTPEESWTAFELVGGYAPNEQGVLEWAPGLILNAVSDNRWLVLDETNRADMDKIMGPLITWLSEQTIEVGRTKPHDGERIELGWTELLTNRIEISEQTEKPVKYLVGRSWRMLGTYNPQDALRVFRFGQALSRRFVVVPIPAITPGQFDNLLKRQHPNLAEEVHDAIYRLYSAHYEHQETVLGPAVFLKMGRYYGIQDQQSLVPEEKQQAETVVESYVINVGKYLALYGDDVLNSLGDRIIGQESIIDADQWQWVIEQIDVLV